MSRYNQIIETGARRFRHRHAAIIHPELNMELPFSTTSFKGRPVPGSYGIPFKALSLRTTQRDVSTVGDIAVIIAQHRKG
ncbi:MAG: hypothetical protein M2R45_04244 [Verrucomicrobia subdivision 3 bacterium]|nr:hypothetical protein [Limisphaerales bacterium]MCS1412631.1 hypothetical protein [Limisphaerales bacterium]